MQHFDENVTAPTTDPKTPPGFLERRDIIVLSALARGDVCMHACMTDACMHDTTEKKNYWKWILSSGMRPPPSSAGQNTATRTWARHEKPAMLKPKHEMLSPPLMHKSYRIPKPITVVRSLTKGTHRCRHRYVCACLPKRLDHVAVTAMSRFVKHGSAWVLQIVKATERIKGDKKGLR
jgi:hypothetical protein